jgi:transcriptional regulator
MYVPRLYEAAREEWLHMVVRDYPLAILVTNDSDVPAATHLPIVFPDGDIADLAQSTLLGHLNKANPQWDALVRGTRGVLIFTGPGSYITPKLYRTEPAAPTWDYVSVHLTGRIHAISDREETLDVVKRTAREYEKRFGEGWDAEGSLEYFREIGPGVGAFRFEVESVQAMFKLSQEKSTPVRQRVINSLRVSESGAARDLAKVMDRIGIQEEYDAG